MKAKFKSNGLLSERHLGIFLGGDRSAYVQHFHCLWRCAEPTVTYQVYEDSLYELYNLYNKE